MLCINLLSTGPAAKEKCDALSMLILACLAITPPRDLPDGVSAAAFLSLLEALANLQIRLVSLVLHLSPPKANYMNTNDPVLIKHVLRLLHEVPVSAANAKDLLLYCRHIFGKIRKLPPTDSTALFLHANVSALVAGGALFARQRTTGQRVLAHTVVQELLAASMKHLPLETLDELLDVFAAELLDSSLGVQARSSTFLCIVVALADVLICSLLFWPSSAVKTERRV
jgi:hypothetical protein